MGWESRAEILLCVAFRKKVASLKADHISRIFIILFCFKYLWYNNSLTTNSGINATCPPPVPKKNFTECNDGRQVCLSGVGSGKFVELSASTTITQALSLRNSFWDYAAFSATFTHGSGKLRKTGSHKYCVEWNNICQRSVTHPTQLKKSSGM